MVCKICAFCSHPLVVMQMDTRTLPFVKFVNRRLWARPPHPRFIGNSIAESHHDLRASPHCGVCSDEEVIQLHYWWVSRTRSRALPLLPNLGSSTFGGNSDARQPQFVEWWR